MLSQIAIEAFARGMLAILAVACILTLASPLSQPLQPYFLLDLKGYRFTGVYIGATPAVLRSGWH